MLEQNFKKLCSYQLSWLRRMVTPLLMPVIWINEQETVAHSSASERGDAGCTVMTCKTLLTAVLKSRNVWELEAFLQYPGSDFSSEIDTHISLNSKTFPWYVSAEFPSFQANPHHDFYIYYFHVNVYLVRYETFITWSDLCQSWAGVMEEKKYRCLTYLLCLADFMDLWLQGLQVQFKPHV